MKLAGYSLQEDESVVVGTSERAIVGVVKEICNDLEYLVIRTEPGGYGVMRETIIVPYHSILYISKK